MLKLKNLVTLKVCIGLCVFGLMFSSLGYAEIVGYWHFDEGKGDVAKDSSGKNNHGKLVGPNWVDGKLGKALEFDGKDDYVDAGIDASLDVKSITMAMWVWFDHIPYVHDIALNKEEAGKSMTELALQWLMSQPHVDSVTLGASKIEHLEENLKAADGKLDEATLKACDEVWKQIRGDHFQYNR